MPRVIHSFETVHEDVMSTKRVMNITIPRHITPDEKTIDGADKQQCGLSAALEAIANEKGDQPRTVREMLRYAAEQSGFKVEADGSITSSAQGCSKEDFFHRVASALNQALEIVGSMPAADHQTLEDALTLAFHAGANFKEVKMRTDHLQNLERELSQANSRKRGNDETRRTSLENNFELFKFMHAHLSNGETQVLKVARWAARRGLGAQSNDLEKNAKANRSRYNRWVSANQNQ